MFHGRLSALCVSALTVAGAFVGTQQSASAATTQPTVAVPIASFAAAYAASVVNPKAAPSGVNPAKCTLTAAHPRPLVLVNGTFTTMLSSFGYLGPTLANAGYCVYGYNYGGPANSPIQATGPVLAGVQALASEVSQVKKATGARQVDLIGYSQGGLISEYYTKFVGKSNVYSVTAIAPTTHGTTLLGLGTLAAQVPGALAFVRANGCAACSDQVRGSAVVTKLDTGKIALSPVKYTVIETDTEDVVTPTGSSFINETGVVNEYVQSYATVDVEDHVSLPYDPVTASLVGKSLAR